MSPGHAFTLRGAARSAMPDEAASRVIDLSFTVDVLRLERKASDGDRAESQTARNARGHA